jgi:UDP-N-acetylmuramate-alanine ligase
MQSISSADLAASAKAKSYEHFYAYESKEDLLEQLTEYMDKNDVIFTMGAGDVYKLKDDIIRLIER